MRMLSAAALLLALAGFGTAQNYSFDIIGTYTGLSNPNGNATTPFTGSTFELKFTTDNTFTPTLNGPDFTALKNITYTNSGVTQTVGQGGLVLCTLACDGVESGGLDVKLSSVYGGDFLEFQLSGAQLFSGTVASPTVLTGIFPVSAGGAGSVGARYQDSTHLCCASEAVANVLVIITVQSPNGPVISSLTPSSALAGGLSFPLTVTGAGFQVGAVVLWNGGTVLSTAFTDVNHVIATVPFNLITSPSIASVTVANPGPVISNAVPFAVNTFITGSLAILTPSQLPSGRIGAFYSLPLTATGGTPPYSFSVIAGTLPAGLSLSGSGVISGTPTVNTTSTFTIGVADNIFASAVQSFSLTISPQTFDFTSALRVAQIAEGLNWKTLFIITNLDQVPTSYNFRFWDDNGNALPLPIVNSSPGSLTGTLAVGGTTFAETPGNSASLLQGWAEVASTGRLGVTTIFRSVTPGKISEGTVTGVSSGSRVILPFDNTQGLGTSIAVANTNPSQSLSISLVFQLDTGAQISGSLFLTAHAHTAFSLATMFPVVAGVRGSILFSASSPDITVVGLRFNPAGSFTSLSSFQ
jgi:large repetitive protein